MDIQVPTMPSRGLMPSTKRPGSPSKEWRSSRGAPAWLRKALLAVLLIGIPLSNVVIFLTARRSPQDAAASDAGGDESFVAVNRGGGVGSALVVGSQPSAHSSAVWDEFASHVSRHRLFQRYERYFNSATRPLQPYGSVLVVSDEFLGPTEASGPATAMTTLAELLAGNGFRVTMLHTRGRTTSRGSWDVWVQYWSGRGVELVALPDSNINYDVAAENALSHRVYKWLSQSDIYDVVHFNDRDGVAYWTLKAKYQGLGFQHTAFVVHLLAPHLWRKVASLESLDDVRDLMVDHMQRDSVKLADLVVAPSQFILRWCAGNGWEGVGSSSGGGPTVVPPGQSQQQQQQHSKEGHRAQEQEQGQRVFHSAQLMPVWLQRRARLPPDPMPFTEVVFFARLELRKGLVLFCDVLDRIERRSPEVLRGIRVTFLGLVPDDQTLPLPGNLHAQTDEYVRFRGAKWRSFTWHIMKDMDTQARLDYMMAGPRLAVLSMIAENSPYIVQECLVAGVPFIATDTGGVAELLVPEDRPRLLTAEATPTALTNRLAAALRDGLRAGRPAEAAQLRPAPEGVEKAWVLWHHIEMHRMEALGIDSTVQLPRHPLVTVCIVHFNNPGLLQQAIDSIENGHYKNVEIVVVDDGSTDPEAQRFLEDLNLKFQAKGWKIGQQESRGPGAGRNLAASLANPDTEYFMFMDDDNVAKPHEVQTFLSVAFHTGAQVMTCVNDYFFGNDAPGPNHQPIGRWVPLGAAREVGIFQNMYGDTNAMVHRDVFWAVGGFPEDFGYALEDWELFSKCVLSGYKLEAVPDPLYWYRLRDTSHSRITATHSNNMRTIRPYLKTIPDGMHHLVMFAQGMKSSHDSSQKELQKQESAAQETRDMLKALASSLQAMCQDGKVPTSAKNRLPNGDFEKSGTLDEGYPSSGWKPFERGYVTDPRGGRPMASEDPGSGRGAAARMTNFDWRQQSGAMRQVILNQDRPGAIVFSGWSKADKVSGHNDAGYAMYVDVVFKDGTKLWGYEIPFDVGTHDWQYKARVLDPAVAIEWLQVYTMFRWHSGTVWFDDLAIGLLKEGLCDYSRLALDGMEDAESIRGT